MALEIAVKDPDCCCPWAQLHMDLAWQRLRTDEACTVHGRAARDAGSMGLEAPIRRVRRRW